MLKKAKGRSFCAGFQAMLRLAALLAFLSSSNLAGQIVRPPAPLRGPAEIPGVYIVTFRQGIPASERSALVRGAGAVPRVNFNLVNALSVEAPDAAVVARLRNDPRVLSVYANHVIYLPMAPASQASIGSSAGGENDSSPSADTIQTATSSSQVVPAGVTRVGAAPGMLSWTGIGVGVAVVDTGLDFAHSDLGIAPEVVGVNSFTARRNGLLGVSSDVRGRPRLIFTIRIGGLTRLVWVPTQSSPAMRSSSVAITS